MKKGRKTGGSAFPTFDSEGGADGMTLRDYFAGQALIGLIVNPISVGRDVPITERAYELADKMLARRSE